MFDKMMGGATEKPFEKPRREKIDATRMENMLNRFDLSSLRNRMLEDVKKKTEEYKRSDDFHGYESEIGYLNNLDGITKELENEQISNSDLLMLKSLIDVL